MYCFPSGDQLLQRVAIGREDSGTAVTAAARLVKARISFKAICLQKYQIGNATKEQTAYSYKDMFPVKHSNKNMVSVNGNYKSPLSILLLCIPP